MNRENRDGDMPSVGEDQPVTSHHGLGGSLRLLLTHTLMRPSSTPHTATATAQPIRASPNR